MHYMRVRRTGDATVTQKPGPKPTRPQHQWSETEQVTELQRQIKGLRTRIKNLEQEKLDIIRRRNAKATAMTKAQHNALLKVFHPDSEAKVSAARKTQLTEAMQVFNSIQFNIVK